MGNCSVKGDTGECHSFVRVLTDSGAILQFEGPKTAGQVLKVYPGYGIFRQGHASSPLSQQEFLISGQFYYLLPLKVEDEKDEDIDCSHRVTEDVQGIGLIEEADQTAENDEQPKKSMGEAASDFVENLSNGSALEVLPSVQNGVWRVKLVIDTKQLEEILSEQGNTEALIEKMRMAATASSTPKRTKNAWGVGWKPILSNLFRVPISNGK
ncbi:UvrABC system protein C [Quillaja saponaria]|uniref:UvrABC system protein C n=1 Tax=Quillaja saponaria TaxID=32244 RepID=A0AAD7L6I9_QUISA|nr:UvrABC system protein C [Quillaja saponaria]